MTANVHRRTPTVAAADSRGLILRQIAYLRTVANEPAIPLVTRQTHDTAGRQIAQWDPRISVPAVVSVYDLGGQPLKVDSVDAGWRLSLPGLSGQALQRWDGRGVHWLTRYDDLLRVVSIDNSADPTRETFSYADASVDAGLNLRGQLLELHDPSGSLHLHGYDLLGQPLHETRTFTDAKAFVSRRTFSPLGAVLEQIDAGGHRQQSRYDLAGQLKHLQVKLAGQNDWQAVLLDARFNAAGQLIEQQAGNGVASHWQYDPANGRLHRQSAQQSTQPPLQDFEYQYDPLGNITGILDHVFTPSHFANQRVDGQRQFNYDSLYRLHSASGYDDAPPSDIPGRPLPTHPDDRRNYIQTYTYDHGGNLLQLRHVRDGASHTRQMQIDSASNRGVRWTSGDPAPDFEKLFDRHGNLNAVQAGQDLLWSPRDQLASVTLVKRENALDDVEHYHYSQGVRVHKRHETHSANSEHFHDVRYLPNLEIRTRDNDEELHVITLDIGFGHVSYLHWAQEKPAGIAPDQLRYTLDDHLGSCVMELDHQAQLISHEGYYPFGATAWMAASSVVEVDYKTVRYSGKEMDVSGLYYYGARYYAAWLQRWISADPAGDVDGPNLYGFVGNNPMRFIDSQGTAKAESVIYNYSRFSSAVNSYAQQTLEDIDNIIYQKNIAMNLLMNLAGETINGTAALGAAYGAGELTGSYAQSGGASAGYSSAIDQFKSTPYLEGLTAGNASGDVGGGAGSMLTGGLIRPLVPQTSTMSVSAIDAQLGFAPQEDINWRELPGKVLNPGFLMNRVVGSVIGIMGGALAMGSRVQEAEDIQNRLDPVKIKKIDTMLSDWKVAVEERWANAEAAFNALGSDMLEPGKLLPNVNHMTSRAMLAPIRRSALQEQTASTLDYIYRAQNAMDWYKEVGTTDNQWIMKNPVEAKKRGFTLPTVKI